MSYSSEKLLRQEIDTLQKAVETLRQENRDLARLANMDGLTGLDNRREAERCLDREISRASRYGRELSLILFDIDRFKIVNDTFGHSAGDDVLMKVGVWLQKELRSADRPSRWGGDEFLILCPETGIEKAVPLAERLRFGCEAGDGALAEGLSMSFGVAAYSIGQTAKELIRRADQALYAAKAGGGNQVRETDPSSVLPRPCR